MGKNLSRFFNTLILFAVVFSFSILKAADSTKAQSHKNEFSNPILAGFYPDPSICKVGGDYYIVNSTFSYYPGITVFHSKDLTNWNLIGYVLDRPEQLDLDGAGVTRGIFAPAIRYNKGIFYVTCTLVDKGGNFVATAKSPSGPWSNPVWLPQVNGIDPSLFFDNNGKAYLVYNSIPPDDKSLYDGHRTIRMREFDIKNLKVSDEEKILINGGTDITKKPVWIEGPHILKKDGYYYLICAEGGTAEQHSEVVFRSKKVDGPYISYKNNPILTQRNLDPKRDNPVTCAGHADFVQTRSGDWWAVFLGSRPYQPYEEYYCNTGRDTYLAPVKWIDGWPVINPGHKLVQYYYPDPMKPVKGKDKYPYSGNVQIKDNFDKETLNINWQFLRTPKEKWYDLTSRKGFLGMKLRPETCSGLMNPSFLAHRQNNLYGYASASLDFSPKAENEKAGLVIFQNESRYYFICKSLEGNEPVIQLYKSKPGAKPDDEMELLASQKLNEDQNKSKLNLKIEAEGNVYSFYYGLNTDKWNLLKDKVDATFLSTRLAGGFVGCMYALYATSSGKPSDNKAYFDWFEYKGNDKIYK